MSNKKIVATSFERYNGGIATKRLHGSSTITRFYVRYEGDEPGKWVVIEGKGPTPGERKTNAINSFRQSKQGE